MPARRKKRGCTPGLASESLQGRNPRDRGTVYGDLKVRRRLAGVRGGVWQVGTARSADECGLRVACGLRCGR